MINKKQSAMTLDKLLNYKPTKVEKVRWFFKDIFSIPSNIGWWFKYRFVRKYQFHKIDTGYRPNYYDPCVSIPAALFEQCSKFVEYAEDIVNWESDAGHSEAWEAFKSARDYWRGGYSEHFGNVDEDFPYEAKELLCGIINHVEFMWYP